jgi:hypothetical protein
MDSKDLDLTDLLVFAMASRNHMPREQWTGGGQLLDVTCDQCGNRWPCPTRQKLSQLKGLQK